MYGAVENTGDLSNIDEVQSICATLHTEFSSQGSRVCVAESARGISPRIAHIKATSVDNNVNGEDEMTNYLCVHTLTCEYSR
jgi:hypothetical protein